MGVALPFGSGRHWRYGEEEERSCRLFSVKYFVSPIPLCVCNVKGVQQPHCHGTGVWPAPCDWPDHQRLPQQREAITVNILWEMIGQCYAHGLSVEISNGSIA